MCEPLLLDRGLLGVATTTGCLDFSFASSVATDEALASHERKHFGVVSGGGETLVYRREMEHLLRNEAGFFDARVIAKKPFSHAPS
jgi:hypothetical protein